MTTQPRDRAASRAGNEAAANERTDFETLLLEEGERSYWLTYASPIARIFSVLNAYDRAQRVPVRPWVLGECCDHIYPHCPAVVRTGRLDVDDGKWWLGTYRTVDDPDNPMYLDPEWDNPNGDVCGWCFRVWRARAKRELAVAS